jgi:osmotically-inducible protein OsmY
VDEKIHNEVLAELRREPRVRSGEIDVSVSNGAVTLTGWVDSDAQRLMAGAVAGRIDGVKVVANELRVRTSPSAQPAGEGPATILAAAVRAELSWDPRVQAGDITVSVNEGVVLLGGRVDTFAQRRAAERAAHRVRGVKAVANDIEVRPSTPDPPSDSTVAEAIAAALRWNDLVPADTLEATVAEGWVTLTGEVESEYQRWEAEHLVARLKGVTGVTNVILLRPSGSASAVRQHVLDEALRRNAQVDMDAIKVIVEESAVILIGAVRSWAEREVVEHTAWSAPGVTSVDNRIVVAT